VLGQVDDIAVILIALQAFLKLCPAAVVDFHRAALAQGRGYCPMPSDGEIIDAEFRRDDATR
jgi:uncharacterized membrane protein YkvA (DUF1232 family)